MEEIIPVIDLFAGPGGLGEGFSASGAGKNRPYFKIVMSVEKDPSAHSTLELRSFFRSFDRNKVPDEYYAFLRGEISKKELYRLYPDNADKAENEALLGELGSGSEFDRNLDRKITEKIGQRRHRVLIGGPPCQAYSVAGRVRNKGISGYIPEHDNRHFLYKEYLRIIAAHRPPVFIMENVKGILSSKIHGHRFFDRILSDLQNPSEVFPEYGKSCSYRIRSLVHKICPDDSFSTRPSDYIVKCENFGIPQSRHRVILMGIRNDYGNNEPDLLKPANESISAESVLGGLPPIRSGISGNAGSFMEWKECILNGLSEIIKYYLCSKDRGENRDLLIKKMTDMHNSEKIPEYDRGGEFIPHPVSVHDSMKWWFLDKRTGGICNHTGRSHMKADIYRYLFASCFAASEKRSPKLDEFPDILLPNHRNAGSGHFKDRFRVQVAFLFTLIC